VLAEHFSVDDSGNLTLGRATRAPRGSAGERSVERHVGPVTKAARSGWIEVQCRTAPSAQTDEKAVLDAATALPTDSEVLGLVGLLVQRLATGGEAGRAAELLVAIARSAVRAGLSHKAESRSANRLRGAMRATFRSATAEQRRLLLAQVPDLPVTSARILVASAAQECFGAVRHDLDQLLEGTLPSGVRQQIHDDLHARRRTGADGVLPAVLAPLDSC
jgi:hypothetical protein